MADEAIISAGSVSKSAEFVPFLSETQILQQLKTTYMTVLNDVANRYKEIGSLALSMYNHIERIAYPDEAIKLRDQSRWLSNRAYILDSDDPEQFNADLPEYVFSAHEFLSYLNTVLQNHNLGFKINESTDELGLLSSILGIKPYWVNTHGLAISYKTDMLARFLVARMADNWDNVILITGKRGIGKSTYAYALATTISDYAERLYEGQRFTVTKNIIFNESKEDVFGKIKTDWKPFKPFIFDEAINQTNARSWWLRDQQQLMELLTQVRYKRTTSIFLAPDIGNFDVVLRNQIAHLIVRVSERGKATLFAPAIVEGTVKDKPAMPIVEQQKYTQYLEKKALNRILSDTFYPIPVHNEEWALYQKIRDSSVSTKDFINSGAPNAKEKKLSMFRECIASFPNDRLAISEDFIADFSKRKAFNIDVKELARWISRSVGLAQGDIYFIKEDKQYINMANPVTQALKEKIIKLYGL